MNGSELAEHVMMILQATNTDVQMEIITALPEIVDDPHHPQVAMGLRDLYGASGKQELTATLLDAFTNLNLGTDLLSDLRGSVMKTVRSVPLADLPTVVKFILGVIPSGEASAVIQVMNELTFLPRLRIITLKCGGGSQLVDLYKAPIKGEFPPNVLGNFILFCIF